MRKIRVAQIGIAHDHADMTFKALLMRPDLFEVVGYCMLDGEEALLSQKGREKYFTEERRISLDDILSDSTIDAVAIECREQDLSKYCIMCLERGFHIHMDKPGSESCPEYERALSIAKRGGLVFHTGYMYRYNPVIREVLRLRDEGYLGDIYSVEAHMDCEHPRSKREWLGDFLGGMTYYLGCHLIDLILLIQGMPEEIINYNSASGKDGVSSLDLGMTVFKYKNGVSFQRTSAVEPGGYMRRQLVISAQKRTVEIRPLEESTGVGANLKTSWLDSASGIGWKVLGVKGETEPFDRYDCMMESFYKYVVGELENPYSYEYEAILHRVVMYASGANVNYKEEIKL